MAWRGSLNPLTVANLIRRQCYESAAPYGSLPHWNLFDNRARGNIRHGNGVRAAVCRKQGLPISFDRDGAKLIEAIDLSGDFLRHSIHHADPVSEEIGDVERRAVDSGGVDTTPRCE